MKGISTQKHLILEREKRRSKITDVYSAFSELLTAKLKEITFFVFIPFVLVQERFGLKLASA